jgi:hypothetical protein
MAGSMLVGAMVGCAAAGYALGSLAGLAVPLGLAGLVVGFVLVHARYRRI